MSRREAENASNIAARQFTAIKHRLDDCPGLGRQLVETDFFFGPQQNARAQHVGLNQFSHEFYLIKADFKEEAGERSQRFFTQIAPAIEIVATLEVACGKMTFVGLDITSEAARYRPYAAGIKGIEQHAMRHQSRHASVAVWKWMNP